MMNEVASMNRQPGPLPGRCRVHARKAYYSRRADTQRPPVAWAAGARYDWQIDRTHILILDIDWRSTKRRAREQLRRLCSAIATQGEQPFSSEKMRRPSLQHSSAADYRVRVPRIFIAIPGCTSDRAQSSNLVGVSEPFRSNDEIASLARRMQRKLVASAGAGMENTDAGKGWQGVGNRSDEARRHGMAWHTA
ncbi:hypothetical protein FA95DRAFT_1048278 [Auriscalpium vulgare]|uniref:Uncharacterized protein n=1 Tax=Auriscalpium vulgare TaxID=40419 RepID=A0ACB8S8Z7_9AGAM|nr:hypothetical protein FA95DRAFT_1048278 [Auriscalpium vulgare]